MHATTWANLKKNRVMWKKPDAKDYTLYNLVYMKCPEKGSLWSQKADPWLTGAEDGIKINYKPARELFQW